MECLDTTKSLKINFKRNIGTVLIIVEGSHDEFELLKQIFKNILHYHYIEKSRNKENFKNYDEFVMKGNENSRVIVINAKNSNLSSIKKDKNYLDDIYKNLYSIYGIDIKNIPVYFIWDRDYHSNPEDITKDLLGILGNSMENKNGEMNGLLLLSYPCIETYVISNFDQNTFFLQESDLKSYIKKKDYRIMNMNMNRYTAVIAMHKVLSKCGIVDYDLDDFSETSLKVFEIQESVLCHKKYYYLLSFVSIILLDLNIITVRGN